MKIDNTIRLFDAFLLWVTSSLDCSTNLQGTGLMRLGIVIYSNDAEVSMEYVSFWSLLNQAEKLGGRAYSQQ
jgi:hypothetical protein